MAAAALLMTTREWHKAMYTTEACHGVCLAQSSTSHLQPLHAAVQFEMWQRYLLRGRVFDRHAPCPVSILKCGTCTLSGVAVVYSTVFLALKSVRMARMVVTGKGDACARRLCQVCTRLHWQDDIGKLALMNALHSAAHVSCGCKNRQRCGNGKVLNDDFKWCVQRRASDAAASMSRCV
jgi:hypothetical protein